MPNIFFKPWIGATYNSANAVFSKKILVIGDSHYCEENCNNCGNSQDMKHCNNFTTEVVNDYLDPEFSPWKSTFSKFMNSFTSNILKLKPYSREDLWNSIAFYNYLQVAAGSDARKTHLYNYNDNSHRLALQQVIAQLQPDVIITWGNRVWDIFPNDLGFGEYFLEGEFTNCHAIYPYQNRKIDLIGITHPSAGYNSSHWSSVFTQLGANS